jgi:AhpD family alkylhydroperoxidase
MDVFAEADVALIGGHSVKDEEIKLGFAITGTIDAESAVSHGSAAVGDHLVLTKPLGAGVLNFCRQIGRSAPGLVEAEQAMATLNRDAAEAMNAVGVSSATDVTGFGLYGHLVSMVRRSGVTVQVWADRLPAFAGAIEALDDGAGPGAIERNREYVAEDIAFSPAVPDGMGLLGFDAQTSGGLLIAVADEKLEALCEELNRRDTPAWIIGRVVANSSGKIAVTSMEESIDAADLAEVVDTPGGSEDTACCTGESPPQAPSACCSAGGEDAGAGTGSAGDSLQAFGSLMRSTGSAGVVDAETKELINFALVVLSRCGPCFEVHRKKAAEMGLTPDQLEEAAWCAIAMGGAPVRMFYEEMKSRCPDGDAPDSCC